MKRLGFVLVFILCFTGCSKQNTMDQFLSFRSQLINSNGFSFNTTITADYGNKIYTFELRCTSDEQGGVSFSVMEPESIQGISGHVDSEGGKLEFDNVCLAFELLADGQLSPVSAPWVFAKTIRSGYITSCGKEGENLHVTIDDSYRDDALTLHIWMDESNIPINAEIIWKNRKILTLQIENFQIQ